MQKVYLTKDEKSGLKNNMKRNLNIPIQIQSSLKLIASPDKNNYLPKNYIVPKNTKENKITQPKNSRNILIQSFYLKKA